MVQSFQGALSAPVTQMAWSPKDNALAWTDNEGVFIRWPGCVPPDGVDPVRPSSIAASKPLPQAGKRKAGTLGLFDFDAEEAREKDADPDADVDMDMNGDGGAGMVDLDNDDWILDDLGGGMEDDDEKEKERKFGGVGVREMGE